MDITALSALLAATIIAGTPILFAATGELLAERSGILNLGVEGMMLVGAAFGFICTVNSGNHWLGLMAALAGGGIMASIHGLVTITLRGNQVVSGLALTIFGSGLSGFLGKAYQGAPMAFKFKSLHIPVLGDIPFFGPVLFRHDILVYLCVILAMALWYILYKTRWGLTIRSVGDNPQAADAVGINVARVRFLCTVVGGMMAGLGGAYISLVYAPTWQENMTAGRGWIAVALVIFALWNPSRAIVGAYLFGGVEALTFRLQTMGINISSFFLTMFPYIATILVLVIVTIRRRQDAGAPEALGIAYDREER
ncbi:putative deoxyribose-specific abc transporter, permease protein [hydrocarbon metagenome]|uniref:Putative deoxyribose-specific abc transporter, permease protein n=1 Tax=hydrocarbon metagenome TaxID=938273 RepID=A0A0W8E8T0_9ZZZZ